MALVASVAGGQGAGGGWHQPGGDAGHSGVAAFGPIVFDVLAAYPIDRYGDAVSRAGTIGLVATGQGVAGVAFNLTAGTCWTFHVDDLLVGSVSASAEQDCADSVNRGPDPSCPCLRAFSGIQAYDAAQEAVLIALPGPAEEGVLRLQAVADGQEIWRVRPMDLGLARPGLDPSQTDGKRWWHASIVAVDEATDSFVVGFGSGGQQSGGASEGILAEIDLVDGSVTWAATLQVNEPLLEEFVGPISPLRPPNSGSGFVPTAVTLTDTGLVVVGDSYAMGLVQGAALWFDRSGELVGGRHSETTQPIYTEREVSERSVGDYFAKSAWAAAAGRFAVVALGTRLFVVDPTTFAPERHVGLVAGPGEIGQPPRWWLDTLILPVGRELRAFEAPRLEPRWSWSDSVAASIADVVIVPPGDAYVLVARNTTSAGDVPEVALARVDLVRGTTVQRTPLPISPVIQAGGVDLVAGDAERSDTPRWPGSLLPLPDLGLLVVWAEQGDMVVLGQAPAALFPEVRISDPYPVAGAPITLDLASAPDRVTEEFVVAWGDGTIETLAPGEPGVHQYAEARPHALRVTAIYDDGRTATTQRQIDVGGDPPPDQTFLQEQFSADNQERTFFVLGLLITLVAALVGATRLRRRRTRLQRELAAITTMVEAARGRPLAAEAALAERRAHVRGLLADGRLDAAEVGVLERRLDELGASIRLETIDERFGFLPVGMARTLREMLADGRIQRWEREHFLAALGNDGYLTKSQKALVKRQIEEWFERDDARPDLA